MGITKKAFGKTKDGRQATLYTLENINGTKVTVTDYGACVVSVFVKDKNGRLQDIVLGFDDVAGYETEGTYWGAFIGRNGNRIAGAEVEIAGKTYKLEQNDGKNNLHSGFTGYNNYFYEAETFEEDGTYAVELSRRSPDMEQGFPGNLDVTVTYTLTDDDEFAIEYYGMSDKDTVINLTNHSFFNLEGQESDSVYDHELWIDADNFTPTDSELIPTGEIREVSGTPMDFRTPTAIGARIDDDYEPLTSAGGYDHNYVLNNSGDDLEVVAEVYSPKSGICMEISTDLPGMQLYTGNFITGKVAGKAGKCYKRRSGVCFETQTFPDSCHKHDCFKSSIVKAYKEYATATVFRFYTR